MGFKKSWDLTTVKQHIRAAYGACISPYNDGYISFYAKQDLYQIKWLIDEALKNSPEFSDEKIWLKEQEQKKIIRILKDEQ